MLLFISPEGRCKDNTVLPGYGNSVSFMNSYLSGKICVNVVYVFMYVCVNTVNVPAYGMYVIYVCMHVCGIYMYVVYVYMYMVYV